MLMECPIGALVAQEPGGRRDRRARVVNVAATVSPPEQGSAALAQASRGAHRAAVALRTGAPSAG